MYSLYMTLDGNFIFSSTMSSGSVVVAILAMTLVQQSTATAAAASHDHTQAGANNTEENQVRYLYLSHWFKRDESYIGILTIVRTEIC